MKKQTVNLSVGSEGKKVPVECDVINGIAIHRPFINWVYDTGLALTQTVTKQEAIHATRILKKVNQAKPFSELAKLPVHKRMTGVVEVLMLPLVHNPTITVFFREWGNPNPKRGKGRFH